MSEPDGAWKKIFAWMSGRKTGPQPSARPGHLLLGQAGEELIAARARALGWKILARNWRPEQEATKRFGPVAPRSRGLELDLVALDSETLVFVEVRTRTTRPRVHKISPDGLPGELPGDSAGEFPGGSLDPERLFGRGKQERFFRAANCWLLYKDMWHYPCRFDLFCVGCLSPGASSDAGGALPGALPSALPSVLSDTARAAGGGATGFETGTTDPLTAKHNFFIKHYRNVLEDCHALDSRNAAWQPW